MKLAELKGVPGPVESTMAMSGRQWEKLSRLPKQFSGVGRTRRVLTQPCFQESTSFASPENGVSQIWTPCVYPRIRSSGGVLPVIKTKVSKTTMISFV